jgi:hypothetical protein
MVFISRSSPTIQVQVMETRNIHSSKKKISVSPRNGLGESMDGCSRKRWFPVSSRAASPAPHQRRAQCRKFLPSGAVRDIVSCGLNELNGHKAASFIQRQRSTANVHTGSHVRRPCHPGGVEKAVVPDFFFCAWQPLRRTAKWAHTDYKASVINRNGRGNGA